MANFAGTCTSDNKGLLLLLLLLHYTSQILELLLAFHYDWENETILPGALRHFK